MRWIVVARDVSPQSWGVDRIEQWDRDILTPYLERARIKHATRLARLPSYGAILLDIPVSASGKLARTRGRRPFSLSMDKPLRRPRVRAARTCRVAGFAPDAPTGKGVRVALLDEDFVKNTVAPGRVERLVATDLGVEPDTVPPPGGLHGSDMAAIAAGDGTGPARDSSVVAIRLDSMWNMCVALEDIRANRRARLVYTGSIAQDHASTIQDEVALVAEAVDRLARDGIPVFAAAGNDPISRILPPGDADNAITVGWYDDTAIRSSGGVEGKPTLLANWRRFRSFEERCRNPSTCYATAHIAGYVATWLEINPTLTRKDILRVLEAGCFKVDALTDDEQGFGVFDPAQALAAVPLPLPEPTMPTNGAQPSRARRPLRPRSGAPSLPLPR